MKTSLIWKRLLIKGEKIATSEDIKKLARKLGKDENRSLYYLQEEGYIVRIFRGLFYVKTVEERGWGKLDTTLYDMVALALKRKGVEQWYFGLETALTINNMTHEYFTIDYVLTDSYRTTKVISILDTRFKFYKRSSRFFKKGIMITDNIRYSVPERTVLDLSYQRYLDFGDAGGLLSPIEEYRGNIDLDKVNEYIALYPPSFREKVEAFL